MGIFQTMKQSIAKIAAVGAVLYGSVVSGNYGFAHAQDHPVQEQVVHYNNVSGQNRLEYKPGSWKSDEGASISQVVYALMKEGAEQFAQYTGTTQRDLFRNKYSSSNIQKINKGESKTLDCTTSLIISDALHAQIKNPDVSYAGLRDGTKNQVKEGSSYYIPLLTISTAIEACTTGVAKTDSEKTETTYSRIPSLASQAADVLTTSPPPPLEPDPLQDPLYSTPTREERKKEQKPGPEQAPEEDISSSYTPPARVEIKAEESPAQGKSEMEILLGMNSGNTDERTEQALPIPTEEQRSENRTGKTWEERSKEWKEERVKEAVREKYEIYKTEVDPIDATPERFAETGYSASDFDITPEKVLEYLKREDMQTPALEKKSEEESLEQRVAESEPPKNLSNVQEMPEMEQRTYTPISMEKPLAERLEGYNYFASWNPEHTEDQKESLKSLVTEETEAMEIMKAYKTAKRNGEKLGKIEIERDAREELVKKLYVLAADPTSKDYMSLTAIREMINSGYEHTTENMTEYQFNQITKEGQAEYGFSRKIFLAQTRNEKKEKIIQAYEECKSRSDETCQTPERFVETTNIEVEVAMTSDTVLKYLKEYEKVKRARAKRDATE